MDLKKQDGRVWAVLLWLQKDKWQALMNMTTNTPHTKTKLTKLRGLSPRANYTDTPHIKWQISQLAEELCTSQEGLCSMESVGQSIGRLASQSVSYNV